jgi:hypothetical protein
MIWSAMTPEERTIENAKLDHAEHVAELAERRSYQLQLATMVLRGLTLANGGAIVALFTFLGNGGSAMHVRTQQIWIAFALFVAGLTFTIFAAFCGFLAQLLFGVATQYQAWGDQDAMLGDDGSRHAGKAKPAHKSGTLLQNIGIGIALVSLFCFALGSGFALAGVLP